MKFNFVVSKRNKCNSHFKFCGILNFNIFSDSVDLDELFDILEGMFNFFLEKLKFMC